jgi:Putative zinc-finger/FecR protein
MSQKELDQAIAEVRADQPSDKTVHETAGRVFRHVFDSSFLHGDVDRIRGCADFQALIPSYLSGTLPPARALLVRDHTLECVDCRRELRHAQGQGPREIAFSKPRRSTPVLAWALAATLMIGIGVGLTAARYGILPGQHAVRATVASVEGSLYRISSIGSTLVEVGSVITNADELRTARGSRAILRLVSGGEVEIAESSNVSLTRTWKGATVNLEQGRAIVQASGETGSLYVSTGEMMVPVKNAVLSLNHGLKGSRIALARGSAQVERGADRYQLTAGEQLASSGLGGVPIASEFAWSKDSGAYLALLSEFSTFQKQLQNIATPGLRYASNLTGYVPAGSVVYAAIPNVGSAIAEAKRMFDERLTESEVLRNWWNQQAFSKSADLDRFVTQISSISQYLGEEIVLSAASSGAGHHPEPLLLAQIKQSGLANYLQQNFPGTGLQVITDPATIPASGNGKLLVLLSNNILAASQDPLQLQAVARQFQTPGSGPFIATPFYSRIAKSYAAGVGYLLAIDLEQMTANSVSSTKGLSTGFNNVQYLLLERRGGSGAPETRASLSFAGARQGIASWLGSPGPMGSLDFVSPEASVASSFVMKNPRSVLQEIITSVTQGDAHASEELAQFESIAGVNVLDDIAAPFGSNATFAVDGPLLPIPAWKLVVEVNDFVTLQKTFTTLITRFNQQSNETAGKLQTGSEVVNSRTFYWLSSAKNPAMKAYYTFVDGYLLAGPSEQNLVQAIDNRQTGNTLAASPNFRNQLPADNYTNFSAIVYTNAGSSFGPLAEQLKNSAALTPAQKQSLATLAASSAPGLICIYGEPDRIVAASQGSFLGFNLATLAGIHQGQPLLPLIASSVRTTVAQSRQPARN